MAFYGITVSVGVVACDAWCGQWLRLTGEPKPVYTGQENMGVVVEF